MMYRATLFFVMLLFGALAFGQSADDFFVPTARSENLRVGVVDPFGTTAERLYSGLVMIEVSGTTSHYAVKKGRKGQERSDAFYVYQTFLDVGVPYMSEYNLTYSFNGSPSYGTDGRGIINLVVFIDGMGFVTPNTWPPYNDRHRYRFVIDVGEVPQALTFGLGDADWRRGAGQLHIRLTPVEMLEEPLRVHP